MNSGNCTVCTLRAHCESGSVHLFAPAPLLRARIEALLHARGAAFRSADGVIAIEPGADRENLIGELKKELLGPELEDVRISTDLDKPQFAVSLEQFGKRLETQWFEDALRGDRFKYWFQPIVDASAGTVLGHECLIRLEDDGSWRNGQQIIDAAIARGDIHVFDSFARRTAIRQAAAQHTGGKVFINFMPSSIYDPAFCMSSTLEAMSSTHLKPSDIVFEVVESDKVQDVRHLAKIADFYRAKGFGLALDDVGTGANSLQFVAAIRPDYIKLDKSIIWNGDNSIGRTTIRKLAELGSETGIQVIAEGVEHAGMRCMLIESGISLMQGYFFGRPAARMRGAAASEFLPNAA